MDCAHRRSRQAKIIQYMGRMENANVVTFSEDMDFRTLSDAMSRMKMQVTQERTMTRAASLMLCDLSREWLTTWLQPSTKYIGKTEHQLPWGLVRMHFRPCMLQYLWCTQLSKKWSAFVGMPHPLWRNTHRHSCRRNTACSNYLAPAFPSDASWRY